MNNIILGIPDDIYDYEFMVILPRKDGNYDWYGNYEDVEAYDIANQVGGMVAHNLRVTHKKLKKDIDK